MKVRRAGVRWQRFSRLLVSLERILEGAARLDAYDDPFRDRYRVNNEMRMHALETRIEAEIDRLTAELLTLQLAGRKLRDSRTVAA